MIDLRCSFLVVSSGKPCREVEAHLVAEHRARAGAGAVGPVGAVVEDVREELEIGLHRCNPTRFGRRTEKSKPLSQPFASAANRPYISRAGNGYGDKLPS